MRTFATLTAASLLALAGASAIAQTGPAPTPGQAPAQTAPAPDPRGRGMGRGDFDALTDARIAGILAGLKLNPEQQRLWGPVEQALRARAAERADRFEERRREMRERMGQRGQADQAPDITQRLEQDAQRATRNAQQATERAQRLTALSDAMKPFYASLDDNQKRLLPLLMGESGNRGRSMRMHHHGGRGDMHHGRMTERSHDGMGHHGVERGPQRQ